MTAKYLQENLDEWETRTLLFDVGMLYYLGVRDLCVGFAIRSLGSDLQPSGVPPVPGATATRRSTGVPEQRAADRGHLRPRRHLGSDARTSTC